MAMAALLTPGRAVEEAEHADKAHNGIGFKNTNQLSPLDAFAGANARRRSRSTFLTEEQVATLAEHPPPPVEEEVPEPEESEEASEDRQDEDDEEPRRSSSSTCPPIISVTPSPSLPAGPAGANSVRRNSQYAFAEKMHTTLVLDWDDTIFPTTWVRNDCSLNWRLPLEQQCERGPRLNLIRGLLAKHFKRVEEFFHEAVAYANIVIVTLARRPWVETSVMNFLPEFARLIELHNLKVIYAQEYVDESTAQDYSVTEFMSSEEAMRFWTRVKGIAIHKELDEFHKKHDVSWKNIISVGDSDFERFGTINAGEDYMRREMEGGALHQTGITAEGISKDGHLKRLRTKTVKLLGEPTVEELTAELAILKRWLPHMVRKDEGFDIEFSCSDDDNSLCVLHKLVTGEDEELSWCQLAGMDT